MKYFFIAFSFLVLMLNFTGCGASSDNKNEASNSSSTSETMSYIKSTIADNYTFSMDYYETDIHGDPITVITNNRLNDYTVYLRKDNTCAYFYSSEYSSSYVNSGAYGIATDDCNYTIEENTINLIFTYNDSDYVEHKYLNIDNWYNKDTKSIKLFIFDKLYVGQER